MIYDYHPSHPDRGIMNVIGQAIGELLPNLINDPIIPLPKITQNPFLHWWPTPEYETKQYKNSLMNDTYVVLHDGQSISFNIDTSYLLIGFYINISKTNCVMDLLLNGHTIFSISLSYPQADNIVKIFVPIPQKLQINEIRIRPATNKNINYYALAARQEDFSHENTILTLASFSFCNPNLLDPIPFILQTLSTTNSFQSNKLQQQLENSFKIKQNHEKILCYNTQNKIFQPLLLEEIDQPNIYLVNILSLGKGNITFYINILNNIFYINPFNTENTYFFYECYYDRILSARDPNNMTIITYDWGSCELFQLGCIVN